MKHRGLQILSLLAVIMLSLAPVFAAEGEGEGGQRSREGRGQGDRPDPAARFAAMDTDSNGTISLAEFKAAHVKRIAAMKERMGDRWNEERAAQMPKPEEMFARMDANKDGALTQEEMRTGMQHRPGGPGGAPRGGGEGGPRGGGPRGGGGAGGGAGGGE